MRLESFTFDRAKFGEYGEIRNLFRNFHLVILNQENNLVCVLYMNRKD